MMRYLALDVGDERIGVAISDPTGLIARPLDTIRREAGSASFEIVRDMVIAEGVDCIVVGLPLLPSGDEGEQVASTRAYVRGLREYVDVPIIYWDERDSTLRAHQLTGGRRPRRRRETLDAVAAAVILQDYLNSSSEAPAPGATVGGNGRSA